MQWNNIFYNYFNQYNYDQSFFVQTAPKQFNNSTLIAWSNRCADAIGVDQYSLDWLNLINGHIVPKQINSCATVYSGHQFGQWAGQLGDGRAVLLGSIAHKNKIIELQLKGSGLTPYSRQGDGMAVLRSSIREFLCSEAMAGLNIPTTRALALINTHNTVVREQIESAAILLRTAPSFIRFGHIEHFSINKNSNKNLQLMVNFIINYYYPSITKNISNNEERILALFDMICNHTAHLIAKWQSVGFCHGVMNTDNMSILGLTIDYGPFGFLEQFNFNHICNHSDYYGRYTYINQPKIGLWNLSCLAQALSKLLTKQSYKYLTNSLDNFNNTFNTVYTQIFLDKLGLSKLVIPSNESIQFIAYTLNTLQAIKADMTNFFRGLTDWINSNEFNINIANHVNNPNSDKEFKIFLTYINKSLNNNHIQNDTQLVNWFNSYKMYQLHHINTGIDYLKLKQSMLAINPKYILRNYLAEIAIKKARDEQDYSEINTLLNILEKPFDEQPSYEKYAQLPPAWASDISISCSS